MATYDGPWSIIGDGFFGTILKKVSNIFGGTVKVPMSFGKQDNKYYTCSRSALTKFLERELKYAGIEVKGGMKKEMIRKAIDKMENGDLALDDMINNLVKGQTKNPQ